MEHKTIVCGMDVSKSSISITLLSELPPDLRRAAQLTKKITLQANPTGFKKLQELAFSYAVLEPTGVYSRVWRQVMRDAGIPYRLAGHWEIKAHREALKLFSKNDKNDSLAIAHYGLFHQNNPAAFLADRWNWLTELLRTHEHLTETRKGLVNYFRQKLAYQWPEEASKNMTKEWGRGPRGVFQAELKPKYLKSIAASVGPGPQADAKAIAACIWEIDTQRCELERLIEEELAKYPDYLAALEAVGITTPWLQAHLISAFHPFSQFLRDGSLIWERRLTENNKRVRKNVSLSSFKLACGVGLIWVASGDYAGWKPGGRADVRQALFLHCRSDRAAAKKGVACKELDYGEGNRGVMRGVRQLLELLFWELAKSATRC